MSEKSMKKTGMSRNLWLNLLIVLILMPVTLLVSRYLGSRRYYLSSILLIIYAMVPFFLSFERRKPQAREVVTLSVMSAIAVASRAAFVMVPHFKPMSGIVMITSMAFGSEAGFLVGAVSSFVSNFMFGQGPWTPYQMFAYGIAGFLAGLLGKAGLMKGEKKLISAICGAVIVVAGVGPLLDTCTLLTAVSEINAASAASIYLSGLPVNIVHAVATFATVFLLGKPITEKLERIKIKYGMMSE